jgi:2-succinyl-6-hydroxy-2,4-cyclohexadiene-1-carboxylate synthase
MLNMDINTFIDEWYNQPLFTSLKKHPRFYLLRETRMQNELKLLSQCLSQMSVGKQPSLWDQLSDNRLPILILAGAKDEKFKKISTEMAKCCPYAKRIIVKQCGHNIHFEKPEEFAITVRNFLS